MTATAIEISGGGKCSFNPNKSIIKFEIGNTSLQSIKDKGNIKQGLNNATTSNKPLDLHFEENDKKELTEKFEAIGAKIDIHKNGILYLKELVSFIILV